MKIDLGEDIEKITESIIGGAFDISKALGHGFLEIVYRRALVHELESRRLSVSEEAPFDVAYKGKKVGRYYADLLVGNKVIVEVKAIDGLASSHIGQVLNYLKASGLHVGLLLNFGKPKLEYRRLLL